MWKNLRYHKFICIENSKYVDLDKRSKETFIPRNREEILLNLKNLLGISLVTHDIKNKKELFRDLAMLFLVTTLFIAVMCVFMFMLLHNINSGLASTEIFIGLLIPMIASLSMFIVITFIFYIMFLYIKSYFFSSLGAENKVKDIYNNLIEHGSLYEARIVSVEKTSLNKLKLKYMFEDESGNDIEGSYILYLPSTASVAVVAKDIMFTIYYDGISILI